MKKIFYFLSIFVLFFCISITNLNAATPNIIFKYTFESDNIFGGTTGVEKTIKHLGKDENGGGIFQAASSRVVKVEVDNGMLQSCKSLDDQVLSVSLAGNGELTITANIYSGDGKKDKKVEVSCSAKEENGNKIISEFLDVYISPSNTPQYDSIADCNKCSSEEQCIVEGNYSINKNKIPKESCIQVSVNNLYVLYNSKLSKATQGYYLCSPNSKKPKYRCGKIDSTNKDTGDLENLLGGIQIGDELTCEELLCGNEKKPCNAQLFVKLGIIVLRVISPILLIALSAADFMKAISQQEEDAMIKAWKRFGTRCVIVVIIMLLPTILNILSTLLGIFDSCGIW